MNKLESVSHIINVTHCVFRMSSSQRKAMLLPSYAEVITFSNDYYFFCFAHNVVNIKNCIDLIILKKKNPFLGFTFSALMTFLVAAMVVKQ